MRGLNAETKRSPSKQEPARILGAVFLFPGGRAHQPTPIAMPKQRFLCPRRPTRNPNHNLWNNNGTWWLHYTCYPTELTKERRRRSLQTRDLAVARCRRDSFLEQIQFHPGLSN